MTDTALDKIKVYQALWRDLDLVGLTPAAVLREAHLPTTLHLRGTSYLTTAEFFSLLRVIENFVKDPCLGAKLVAAMDTAVLPPPCLAAFYSRDFREGLHRMVRFKQLCVPERVSLVEAEGVCTVSAQWLFAGGPVPDSMTDMLFASFVELGRRGTAVHIVPRRIEFTRPDPGVQGHREYFGCAIQYAAVRDVMVLDVADLDRPFMSHNRELLELLTPMLASALKELQANGSASEQVKMILKRVMPSGRPEIAEVARELGLSERTLQRRITDEGASFRELLLEARKELVRHYLAEPDSDIAEIAFLLGYKDANSFYRAFRSWEGITPARWRDLKRIYEPRVEASNWEASLN